MDSMLPRSIRRVYRTSLSGSRELSMSRPMYKLQCQNQCQGESEYLDMPKFNPPM